MVGVQGKDKDLHGLNSLGRLLLMMTETKEDVKKKQCVIVI